MRNCVLILVIFLTYSCNKPNGDQIWPQFRGINCSGVGSDNAKAPVKFENTNLSPLKQLWKLRIFVYMRLSIVKIGHILRENAGV